jgi:hypothetical protein
MEGSEPRRPFSVTTFRPGFRFPLRWQLLTDMLDGYPSSVIVVLRLGAVRADQLTHEQVTGSADRADPYFHFRLLTSAPRLGHGEGPPPENDNDH